MLALFIIIPTISYNSSKLQRHYFNGSSSSRQVVKTSSGKHLSLNAFVWLLLSQRSRVLRLVLSGGSRISRGPPTRRGWGGQPIIWPKFVENCMKMKKTVPRGGVHPNFYCVDHVDQSLVLFYLHPFVCSQLENIQSLS